MIVSPRFSVLILLSVASVLLHKVSGLMEQSRRTHHNNAQKALTSVKPMITAKNSLALPLPFLPWQQRSRLLPEPFDDPLLVRHLTLQVCIYVHKRGRDHNPAMQRIHA